MEVLFLDVGFGTCNLILTGSGEAIVIDAGRRSKETLAALHYFSVSHISHLIVSHWHDDHVGGATGVLRAYPGNIGRIWFPFDPAFKKTEFWAALDDETTKGNVNDNQINALMVTSNASRRIWSSPRNDAELRIISPCFMENNRGVFDQDSNATCGVLTLRISSRFVVFAGDATLAQWEQVRKRVTVPIQADVLAVPHHAGAMWPAGWTDAKVQMALGVLYREIVQPKIAVISASTLPGIKHPREDVIAALRKVKAQIMCTQMTHRCTSELETARKQQTSLPIVAPGRSSPTTQKRGVKAAHVACAGSIIVDLSGAKTVVRQLPAHQTFVSNLPNRPGELPLCRR